MDQSQPFMALLGGVRDEAGSADYMERNLAHWEAHGFGLWMLRDAASADMIGRAVLRHLDVEGVDEVEVGYGFYPEFWGRGLATEVARACVRIAFERLGLPSVVAVTHPANTASQRVMRKAGLVYEREVTVGGLSHLLFRTASAPKLRLATSEDVPAIESLIARSARGLSASYYTPVQIEGLLRFVFGADSQLIADGTYYVCESEGQLVAVGGWSRRRTLFGGDRMKQAEDPLLDPALEPARIRAFFVHPDRARQGLGRRIFEQCVSAARAAGFGELALVATLPGEPLYQALGFRMTERFTLELPDGTEVPVSHMVRRLP
jgi:GNAT superfamily N-acetyltransferase